MDRERLRQGVLVAAVMISLIGCPICCFAIAAAVVALAPVHTAAARLMPSQARIGIGETTTVVLRVQDVTEMYGYQVTIDFDPDMLEVVDADERRPGVQVALGSFLSADFVHQNAADNGAGTIVCVVSQLAPTPSVTGSGELLAVTFRGKAQGTSAVALANLILANAEGIEIMATRYGTQIAVRR